ncbi:MAG: hypothetical protein WKF87_14705 [Chryseolinea sp.]
MIARQISILAFSLLITLLSCDTDRNVIPVYETYFTKYYGEDGNQESADLLVNDDGSMVMLANSTSQTGILSTPFIVKVDASGNVVWQRELGEEDEVAVDVEVDRQGNLIVVSTVRRNENSRIRIYRITQEGKGLDSVLIVSTVWQVAKSVTQVSDGDYLIGGYAGPDLVQDPELALPEDQNDLLVYRVDEQFSKEPKLESTQGGEHSGKIVDIFESKQPGEVKYLIFGDSDRPLTETEALRQNFEVIVRDRFGTVSYKGPLTDDSQVKIASTAIETPLFQQEAYLMVGSTVFNVTNSNIFFAQYVNDKNELRIRVSKALPFDRKMEGISAAIGLDGSIFILANEFQDNNNRDMFLVKLGSDGDAVIATSRFGSLEGDDSAGAVRVLADGRIAVLGTIQLETQKKMVLIILSPDGNFTNG